MIEKKIYLCFALLLSFSMLLTSNNCFAQGKIIIQPKIEVGAQNNSNFWHAEDEEISVNTYTAKPGIVFGYETAKTEISIDATIDMYWFDDQDTPPAGIRSSSDDDYVGLSGEASVNHQLTSRLNIGLADEIYTTRDPARADGNNNSISRDKYTINYFKPAVYYEIDDKFGVRLKYRNTYTDYEKDFEDSTEHRGVFDFYYNLNRTSAVFIDYQIWARDYNQNSLDYTSNQISLNYEREFNYLSIKAGAGYHNRSFDNDAIDELDLFSWKIEVRGQDADSTRKTTRSWLELDLGQEMNDDGTGDNYFVASYVRFEGGYRLLEKLALSVNGQFQNSDYETDSRDEDTIVLGGRVEYQALDFLAVGLEGGYEDRDSNIAGNSYEDSFVLFTLDVDYDFGSR